MTIPEDAAGVSEREEPTAAAWVHRAKWVSVALAILLAVLLPFWVSTFWVNVAIQVVIFGLLALSINIIAGYGGMVTLGHAGLLGVAGYGVAILTTKSSLPLAVAILAGLMICAVVSASLGGLAVRARGHYFVMITLAEGMVLWGIAQRWQELTGGENGITGVPKPSFAQEDWQYYYFVLVVAALCTVVIARLVRSPFGLTLKGIRESEDRLPPLGYRVSLHKVVAFTVSGVVAGVAGALLAMYNNFIGPNDLFFLASAKGLLISILGGVGTLSGAFVGASVVMFIQNYVSSYVERWQTLLGVVFVLVILFAPDGVVGAWTRMVWARVLRRFGAGREAARVEVATVAASASVVSGEQVIPTSEAETAGGGEAVPHRETRKAPHAETVTRRREDGIEDETSRNDEE